MQELYVVVVMTLYLISLRILSLYNTDLVCLHQELDLNHLVHAYTSTSVAVLRKGPQHILSPFSCCSMLHIGSSLSQKFYVWRGDFYMPSLSFYLAIDAFVVSLEFLFQGLC